MIFKFWYLLLTSLPIVIHSVESSIPYVGMLTNSKYQIFVWMMFMTLLGCKLSAWVKKIWIFSFWLFSDTPYCIVVKSQQNSKGELLAKSGKLIFQRRSFLEGKIKKMAKKFLKIFIVLTRSLGHTNHLYTYKGYVDHIGFTEKRQKLPN